MDIRVRSRLMVFVVLVAIVLSLSAFAGIVFVRRSAVKAGLQATADIKAQLTSLAKELPPGGHGTIRIPHVPANELIVLPPYCDRADIERELPAHSAAFRDRLLGVAKSDITCPALVWTQGDNIVSICSLRPNVAMQMKVKLIDLKKTKTIGVIKELHSSNHFHSLTFE